MEAQSHPKAAVGTGNESLDSWKAIAGYLKCDERTVRRWEKEGLPIHRHMHKKRASVYAYRAEVAQWWERDRVRLQTAEATAGNEKRRLVWWVAPAALALLVVAFSVTGIRDRLFGRPVSGEIVSIAVLPLKNLSPDADQSYLADGVTEALITQLGKISALDVISHQSMLRYRGVTKSLPEIANELKVRAVVEGTVLRHGDKIRITANLV